MLKFVIILLTFAPMLTFSEEPSETIKSIQQFYSQSLEEPEALIFIPPEGWLVADPKLLTPRVKLMVMGKGQHNYPPSINLGMEPFPGTTKEYLKIVKTVNETQGAEWKDLGLIKTQAGNASLSQVDMPSEWGTVRLMHVILIRNGTLYILTAAALKEEFPLYYKQFFNAMTSLKFNQDAIEMVSSAKKRSALQKAVKDLKNASVENPFHSESFQNNSWIPFKKFLEADYSDMSASWKNFLLRKLEKELTGS